MLKTTKYKHNNVSFVIYMSYVQQEIISRCKYFIWHM